MSASSIGSGGGPKVVSVKREAFERGHWEARGTAEIALVDEMFVQIP